MRLRFLGCGDAFGSGGRLNPCFHLAGHDTSLLIECGATSLVAMKARGIQPNDIDAIVVTHFHADHFGGIPSFLLDAHLVSKRTRPLTIIAPVGVADRLARLTEAQFEGSSTIRWTFDLTLKEAKPGDRMEHARTSIEVFRGAHDSTPGTALIYRFESEGKVLAYTGDTAWTEEIVRAGQHADLLIAEAYFFGKPIRNHLSFKTLEANLAKIAAKRIILTHMSEDMLMSLRNARCEAAFDGKTVEF